MTGLVAMDTSGANKTEGGFQALPATHWTTILEAGTGESGRLAIAQEKLSRLYWLPVYWFFRRLGENHEDAKDLTQGFFADVLLGRGIFQRVQRRPAMPFRAFLRTALTNYRRDVHRGKIARKRAPEGGVLSLEGFDIQPPSPPQEESDPNDATQYVLAAELLERAMSDAAKRLSDGGMHAHWKVFRARVLDPITTGAQPVPCADLCRQLHIDNEARVSNMVVTAKRELRRTVLAHARMLVCAESSNADVCRELHELIESLERRAR